VASEPAAGEQSVMDMLANAPLKMMPGNNTGNPIHTAMNPNAPAQNVTGGYPILRSAENGDLAKSADDAVDIESITKEMQSMEDTVENTPVADQTGDVAKSSAPAIDVSAALQDVIAKSLQGALAGTFAQLDSVAKAVDRIETKSAEQTTAVWDALKPLSETATATKDMVTPLVEKVAALEGVAESVKQLSERLAAIENQPVDAAGAPILRGQSVSKAIGIDGGQTAEQIDESTTLAKMIDETHDPLVRTKLRERKALIDTRRVLFGNR
jgi:prophage DNA circulation protein